MAASSGWSCATVAAESRGSRRVAPSPGETPAPARFAAIAADSVRQRAGRELLHFSEQLVQVEWLGEVPVGPELLNVTLHRPIRAEDEQRHVPADTMFQLGDKLPAVHHRHHQIEENDAGPLVITLVDRLFAFCRHADAISIGRQAQTQYLK